MVRIEVSKGEAERFEFVRRELDRWHPASDEALEFADCLTELEFEVLTESQIDSIDCHWLDRIEYDGEKHFLVYEEQCGWIEECYDRN